MSRQHRRTMGSKRTTLAALAVGASLVAALVAAPATALAKGSGTLSVRPASTTTSTGSTFTVTTVARAGVPISGAQTPLTFDRNRLQVTAIAKAGPWAADGAVYFDFPSTEKMEAAIAAYNDSGRVASIATAFIDGASSEPANEDLPVIAVTFEAILCGSSTISIPSGPNGGEMIDGTPGTPPYGYPLDVTVVSGTVVNDCPGSTPSPTPGTTPTPTHGSTPSPTPGPTPTPRPNPSATAVSGTTHVTGTLADGYLTLTVPASAPIPLEWDTTNRAAIIVQIDTNRSWSLGVWDANTGPDEGHMRSGASHLDAPMLADTYPGTVDLETGGTLASGRPTSHGGFPLVVVGLQQPVGDGDLPGTYGISLVFRAMTTF